jgi:hypothetical protein
MKPRFNLTCILGSAVLISQLTLSVAVAAEPGASFTTSGEIEKYAIDTVEKIRKTALTILSISSDQQTFENTLRPWSRLSAQLSQDLDALNELSKLDFPFSTTASQVSDGLHAYLLEVDQNPELRQTLMNCALAVAHNAELDPFQRYIGTRFVKNSSDEPVYLRGAAEEQHSPATDYTVLDLKSGSLTEVQVSGLAHEILSKNADAVCIQEIAADDHAYELYEVLHTNYAHFVYVPSSSTLSLSESHRTSGMFIASKLGANALEILLARSHRDRNDDRGGASCEGGVTGRWGDGNGIQWEGYVRGEAHDGKGNYAEGQVTQKDDGTGKVDIRGGHESDNK